MIRNFIALLLLLSLSSCVANWWKPQGYRIFRQMPKGGSPGYELGWIHGCESGLGTQFGGALYMTFYSWKRDVDIISSTPDIPKIRSRYKKELRKVDWNNPADIKKNFSDYKKVFWAAHIFCRHSALGALQSADMAPPNPGETRYDPTAHHLGSIYKIDGKGDTRYGKGGLW